MDKHRFNHYNNGSAYLNTIELIKAGPSSRLSQPFEELTHGLVVQTIGTVKNHTLETYSTFNISTKKKQNKTQRKCRSVSYWKQFCVPV